MEAVGQAYPLLWPNMPLWLAWLLLIGGAVLIVLGALLWLWPWLRKHLPAPMWLGQTIWGSLYWLKFAPRVELAGKLEANYKIHEGRASECGLFSRIEVENRCPDSALYIIPTDGRLVVSQRRLGGPRRDYVFRPVLQVDLGFKPGKIGWYDINWDWVGKGQPEGRGPNLDASFEWKIYGLLGRLDGPRTVIRELAKMRGENLGTRD